MEFVISYFIVAVIYTAYFYGVFVGKGESGWIVFTWSASLGLAWPVWVVYCAYWLILKQTN